MKNYKAEESFESKTFTCFALLKEGKTKTKKLACKVLKNPIRNWCSA